MAGRSSFAPRGPLWAHRHNISVSSLREGCHADLASGVNLLTVGAIPDTAPCRGGSRALNVAFPLPSGLKRVARWLASVRIGPVRNPDQWSPKEPEESGLPPPPTRHGALVGLVVVLLLVAGGLLLTRVLRSMSQLQDCALSGRSNCVTDRAP